MGEPKVSVPLSYLENLIRDTEQLNCAFIEVSQGLVTAAAEVEKLQKELESFKRVKDIPLSARNEYSPPRLHQDVEREIQRLFVLARGYPERLYSAYAQIRQLLKEEFPDNRINAIKKVRELTGCGLKEAKEFYEGSPYPLDIPRL